MQNNYRRTQPLNGRVVEANFKYQPNPGKISLLSAVGWLPFSSLSGGPVSPGNRKGRRVISAAGGSCGPIRPGLGQGDDSLPQSGSDARTDEAMRVDDDDVILCPPGPGRR